MKERLLPTLRSEFEIPAELLDSIRERAGLSAADHVLLGVQRAMARAAATDPREYRRLLDRDPEAFSTLITELTVGETYFLREREQCDYVMREVLPELRREAGAGYLLRAWSAGCASGEEAYSLAIMARESAAGSPMRIVGTDIAESRLAVARHAEYGEWSLRGVPDAIVDRYFRRNGRRATVAPEIRAMVEFRALNLKDSDWTTSGIRPASMDLIFCRNVLIYLDTGTTARIARGLLDSLAPDGWLFLGASDPALAELVDCEVVVTGAGIAYRRGDRKRRGAIAGPARPADRAPAWLVPHPPVVRPLEQPRESTPPVRDRGDSGSLSAGPHRESAQQLQEANAAYRSGDYVHAADAARDIVAVEAEHDEAWILLVRALANLGRHEEAGLACAAGLDINRTSAELTFLHALLLRQAGMNTDALNALRCTVYLDRNLVVAHLALGDVSLALGDRAGARRAFRNAERLLADTPDAEVLPGADGLTAGRLRAVAQMQLRLLEKPGSP